MSKSIMHLSFAKSYIGTHKINKIATQNSTSEICNKEKEFLFSNAFISKISGFYQYCRTKLVLH